MEGTGKLRMVYKERTGQEFMECEGTKEVTYRRNWQGIGQKM